MLPWVFDRETQVILVEPKCQILILLCYTHACVVYEIVLTWECIFVVSGIGCFLLNFVPERHVFTWLSHPP